ncbi:MAG: hypothetical protein RIR21_2098 [Pseudomonadota bacterium]|jgi:rhodanese-related sulfurtransferase
MLKLFFRMLLPLALMSSASPLWAFDASKVPPIKQTSAGLYLDAREAYALKDKLGSNALFIDIRTRSEVAYLGMPQAVDVHIPYMEHPFDAPWDDKNARFLLEPNNDFGPELARRMSEKHLDKSSVIILMCRSGDRSAKAANLLADLGYRQVYTVVDGFEGDLVASGPQSGQRLVNGWKNAGLPWSYKLDKVRLYFPKN